MLYLVVSPFLLPSTSLLKVSKLKQITCIILSKTLADKTISYVENWVRRFIGQSDWQWFSVARTTNKQELHYKHFTTVVTSLTELQTLSIHSTRHEASTSTRHSLAFHVQRYVVIATKPVHLLQSAQYCKTTGHPYHCPSYIRVRKVVMQRGTDRHTSGRVA